VSAEVPGQNPYVGPRAFNKGERIFGRDREVRQLFQMLAARRIILLHSPSGAGKTSLVQAGLIPRLEENGFQVLPPARLNQEPPDALHADNGFNRYVFSLLLSLEETLEDELKTPSEKLASISLLEYLASRFNLEEDPDLVALIIDQFEELLTIDPTDTDQKQAFFAQVGQVLQNEYLWALFVIREDYLGALEPYIRAIPTRLANTFRLDLLGESAAGQAIQEPARQAGVEFTDQAVEKLVNDLCLVQVQQSDGSFRELPGPYVEPVQLQVVCHRLWQNLPPGKAEITEDDLEVIGDVDQSLAAYYAERVATIAANTGIRERLMRQWIQNKLITKDGVRLPVLKGQNETEGLSNQVINMLVDAYLVRGEKRGGKIWYELAHDRLVRPVRENNETWFEENLSLLQRQAELWKKDRPYYLLLRNRALQEAVEWAEGHADELTEDDRAFLEASQKAQEREEKERQARRQERELAMAQQLAREQQARAEAEARSAEEQRARAEAERQRAEAAAQAARRRLWLLVAGAALGLVMCIAAIAVILAAYSRVNALEAEARADEAAAVAVTVVNEANATSQAEAAAMADSASGFTIDDPDYAADAVAAAVTATSVAVESEVKVAQINATVHAGAAEPTASAVAATLESANMAATTVANEVMATAQVFADNATATAGAPTVAPTPTPRTATATPLPTPAYVTAEAAGLAPSQIAFVSDAGGNDDSIYVMEIDPNGRPGSPKQITQSSGYDWWPTWCGGGTIAFERGDDPWRTQNMEIMGVQVAGSANTPARPLTSNELPSGSAMNGLPSCSPNGRAIAFSSRAQKAPGNDFKIFLAENTNQGLQSPRLLGDGYSLGGNASWSPNSNSVVFMHYVREEGRFQIYLVNLADPDNFISLSPSNADNCKYPAWSPRGDQIAFTCSTGEGDDRSWSLYLYDLSNVTGQRSQAKLLLPKLRAGSERDNNRQVVRHAITPSWSPDGRWIAFSSDTDGDWDIYAYSLPTGNIVNLTEDMDSDEFHPSWGGG
jgi:Tol biopolymer transport system component